MTVQQRRHSREEIARRGREAYERDILPHLADADMGKFIAIDIESGGWEMDESEIAAGSRLRERYPDAQTWMMHAGHDHLRRFGAGRKKA